MATRACIHIQTPRLILLLTIVSIISFASQSEAASNCNLSRGAIQIPCNLNSSERQEALRVLGFGTSAKMLTDPYPLGGYSGLELGVGMDSLPIDDLTNLGSGLTNKKQDVTYPRLTIGKGLYNNIDIFMNMIPYSQRTEISQYGGMLRWGFYQASFLPVSLSTVLHLSATNFDSQLNSVTTGLDLIAGINVSNLSVYMGGGPIEARGYFIGGASGVTDSSRQESEKVAGAHTLVGANVHISQAFLAVQLDRYSISVFSAKLGVRF